MSATDGLLLLIGAAINLPFVVIILWVFRS